MKMTLSEAANLCGRSDWCLREHIKHGRLEAQRTGTGFRNWIVDLDEVIPVLLEAKKRHENRPTGIPRGTDRQPRKPKGQNQSTNPPCTTHDCDRPQLAKGLCSTCYGRMWRKGRIPA